METTSQENTGKYGLYFLISLVAFIGLLIFFDEWFWVALPFLLTYLVKWKGWI